MSENQDELKVQIKAWLKQQNISRNDFAAECFVSPNTVRNWLAKVAIPKDKEALIRLMMEKTEREKKLKEAARANWKPFVVMLSSEDYKLIEEAARRDNMTVEEWAEATLIKDAQKRMKNYYDDSSLPEDVSLGGGSTGGIRSSQTFRPFIISALFCPPQAAAINPGGHGIPLMSRLPAGFRQRAVPRRASPGAGNTDLLCCAPNQLFSCLPFSKSSISVDCESIILSTAFSRLLFPAFGPRESGSAVCSRRLRQDGASGQLGAGPGKEPCSGRIHALYIRIPRPPWKNAAGTAVPEKYPHHHGIGSGTGKN